MPIFDPFSESAAFQSSTGLTLSDAAAVSVPGGGVNTSYGAKVLTIDPTNLIQFFKLNEQSGTTATDFSPEANNGTYNAGVTLNNTPFLTGDGAPLFDGTGDVLDIYSAGLAADFSFTEFSLTAWVKVRSSAVWSDGTDRRVFTILVDGNNFIFIRRATAANTLNFIYDAGGTAKQVQIGSQSSVDWMHLALTVSASNNRLKAYINGAQVGSTQTGLGTWSGSMLSSASVIGGNTTGATANIWNGWIAYPTIYKAELSAANVLALATYP